LKNETNQYVTSHVLLKTLFPKQIG